MSEHHQPRDISHNWSRRATMYHIYPLSFADADGDGFGDLKGVMNHLDYLNDGTENSLGIEAIWLSPIYTSPMKDWGYDIADHYSIDPLFGDLNTFDELVRQAHQRGIKIVMDFVPNHTSEEHPWFVQSRSSRDNPRRDWYVWQDPKPGGGPSGAEAGPPNNWLSVFGGSAWELDKTTGQYYLHSFLKEQPDLNWTNPQVKWAMINVMRFWLERSVDGFRSDAITNLFHDPKLRDDPPNPDYRPGVDDPYKALIHTYSEGRFDIETALNAFCEILGEHEDTFLISEAYLDIPDMMELFQACSRHKLHSPLNFNLMSQPWDAAAYKKFVDDFETALGEDDWPNYVLGNHDRHRLASRMGRDRARLAAMLQLTLRGLPVVYYGEEIGMVDGEIPPDQVRDPFETQVPGLGLGRDPARTPMQWTAGRNAGFSQGKPWLPVAKNYRTVNVATERSNPQSFFQLYRQLIQLRKQSPALLTGRYVPLDVDNDQVFAYLRDCPEERLLVMLNFSEEEHAISCPISEGTVILNSFLNLEPDRPIQLSRYRLEPLEGIIVHVS